MRPRTVCLLMLFSLSILPHFSFLLFAQGDDPSSWENFVNDPINNTIIRDTFRFQSFEGNITDNWNYTTNGTLFDALEDGITGQGGNNSLQLKSGNSVTFNGFNHSIYKNIRAEAGFAARNLSLKSIMTVKANRNGSAFYDSPWFDIFKDGYSISYREEVKLGKNRKSNPIQLMNAYTLAIEATNIPGNGYICIDSVFVYGDIPKYSLLTGRGNWRDTTQWTHLPPERSRIAFISGDVTVDVPILCNEVSISEGGIHIADDIQLEVNNLSLHGTDISFTSKGNIRINEKLTVYRTFEEKGEWYFISFPFDVYQDGIDQLFEMKDDTPNNGGNYFYVLTYNGDRRMSSNNLTRNWDVLIPTQIVNRPIFEKNKGYLIALDAAANISTMTFSSSNEIPTDFGKEAIVSIQVSTTTDEDDENAGWYLCGNPYAAPLSLSQFPKTSDLDGFVYIYDGSAYKSYAIGSDYKLPPFSAFFVKAKTNTDIHITKAFGTDKEILLPVSAPFRLTAGDPTTKDNSLSSSVICKTESFVNGNIITVKNLTESAKLNIYNVNGDLVLQKQIPPGSSESKLLLPNGFYILQVESSTYRTQLKCVINQ